MSNTKSARLVERQLPKNVTAFTDRHGQLRYRFRKSGLPTVYFRNIPTNEEVSDCLLAVALPKKTGSAITWPEGSVVYFLGARGQVVKIGTSTNLRLRFAQLQASSAHDLTLLAFTPGGPALERSLHKVFAKARLRGEWFDRTEELEELIAELASLRN